MLAPLRVAYHTLADIPGNRADSQNGSAPSLPAAVPQGARSGEKGPSDLPAIFSQLPALVWTTDTSLKIMRVFGNPTATSWFPPHSTGLTLEDVFQAKSENFSPIAAHRHALGGHSMTFEFAYHDRWYFGVVEPFFDAEGKLAGTIGVAVNFTDHVVLQDCYARSIP